MARGASGCRSMPRGASGCSSIAQLHCRSSYSQVGPGLGLASESSSSCQDPWASPHSGRRSACSRSFHDDVDMKSSGSSWTESHGNESHRSHGNESHGNESTGSSNGNSRDSALLESSGSNKRSVCFSWFLGGVRIDHISRWVPFYQSYFAGRPSD